MVDADLSIDWFLIIHGADIAQGTVPPLVVAINFNVLKQMLCGLGPGLDRIVLHRLYHS